MDTVGVILLAAGNSSRMERPKQLLAYRGTTLLRHAASTAVATGFVPVVVVLGSEAGACGAEVSDLPVHAVVNAEWKDGMGTSVRAGVQELLRVAPQIEGVLIMLHDQPMISAGRLRALVKAWKPGNDGVASVYGGTIGVPALFTRELFSELAGLAGLQGAKRVLEAHLEQVLNFDMPEGLEDIDTQADYERLVQNPHPGP
jgi:molybdenum cofactor cytidylyltransferase